MTKPLSVLVAGASQPLGAAIALRLAGEGHNVTATRRRPEAACDTALAGAGVRLDTLDLTDLHALAKAAAGIDVAVLTPILAVAAPAARVLAAAGVARGVVFSSNNVAISGPDPVYDRLRAAEADLLGAADTARWAILRPTMIYGHPGDGNMAELMRHVSRLPVFPRLGSGTARQQPVHVEDLARLAAGLASGAWEASGILPVGGRDTVTQAGLVALARRACGASGLVLPVPLAPVRTGVQVLSRLGLRLPLSPAQLARLELDKAAVGPAAIPATLVPSVTLEAGLARLAAELGL